ncbi:hypothetical protein GCM10020220_103180 [Nonomuraea rubra]|uniref:tetratricopeptide repeat protein n=1 Tax=Nonomuraea rubra TaxID=46180 RepID=UPI0031EB7186
MSLFRSLVDEGARLRVYHRNEMMCSPARADHNVYLIDSGYAREYTPAGGREALHDLRGAGDLVGELAFWSPAERVGVDALTEVRAWPIDLRRLREHASTGPAVATALVQELFARNVAARRHEALARAPVAARLAVWLLHLDERYGLGSEQAPPLTMETLAGLVGSSADVVQRQITQWTQRGWLVRLRYRRLRIADPSALRDAAGSWEHLSAPWAGRVTPFLIRPAGPADPLPVGEVPKPRQLPADMPDFIGRQQSLDLLTAWLKRHRRTNTMVVQGLPGVGKTALVTHWGHLHADRFPDGQIVIDLRGQSPSQPPMSTVEALGQILRSLGIGEPASDEAELMLLLYRSRIAGRRLLLILDNAADPAQVRALLPGSKDCVVLVTSRTRMAPPARHRARRPDGPAGARPGQRGGAAGRGARRGLAAGRRPRRAGRAGAGVLLPPVRAADLGGQAGREPRAQRAVTGAGAAPARPAAGGRPRGGVHAGAQPGVRVAEPGAAAGVPARRAAARARFHARGAGGGAGRAGDRGGGRGGGGCTGRTWWSRCPGRATGCTTWSSGWPGSWAGTRRRACGRPGRGCSTTTWRWRRTRRRRASGSRPSGARWSPPYGWPGRSGAHGMAWRLAEAVFEPFRRLRFYENNLEVQQGGLTSAMQVSNRRAIALMRSRLGSLHRDIGPSTLAARLIGEALADFAELGDLEGQARALNELAEVHGIAGNSEDALRYAGEALELHRAIDDPAGVASSLHTLSRLHLSQERYELALHHAGQALDVREELGDRRGTAQSLIILATVQRNLGEPNAALSEGLEALSICHDLGDEHAEAETLLCLAEIYDLLRLPHDAQRDAERALAGYTATGDQYGCGRALCALGRIARNGSRYAEALSYYEQALTVQVELHHEQGKAETLGDIGLVHWRLSDYLRADEYLSQALAISRVIRDGPIEARMLNRLARVRRRQGRSQVAFVYALEALDIVQGLGNRRVEADVQETLTYTYLSLGQPRSALRAARAALAIREELRDNRGSALLSMAQALLAAGRSAQALEPAREAVELQHETGTRDRWGAALTTLALVLLDLDRTDEAVVYARQARDVHRECGTRRDLGCALRALGLTSARLGHRWAAVSHLREAVRTLEEVGDVFEAKQVAEELRLLHEMPTKVVKSRA